MKIFTRRTQGIRQLCNELDNTDRWSNEPRRARYGRVLLPETLAMLCSDAVYKNDTDDLRGTLRDKELRLYWDERFLMKTLIHTLETKHSWHLKKLTLFAWLWKWDFNAYRRNVISPITELSAGAAQIRLKHPHRY